MNKRGILIVVLAALLCFGVFYNRTTVAKVEVIEVGPTFKANTELLAEIQAQVDTLRKDVREIRESIEETEANNQGSGAHL